MVKISVQQMFKFVAAWSLKQTLKIMGLRNDYKIFH